MKAIRILIGHIAVVVVLVFVTQAAAVADIAQKAALQAAMLRYIDRSLVDGVYLHLNRESGEVGRLYPSKAHPQILRMGEYFVLCSDFKDAAGGPVNIDFYIARDGSSYAVFASAVDDREMLMRWIGEGKVEPLE